MCALFDAYVTALENNDKARWTLDKIVLCIPRLVGCQRTQNTPTASSYGNCLRGVLRRAALCRFIYRVIKQ